MSIWHWVIVVLLVCGGYAVIKGAIFGEGGSEYSEKGVTVNYKKQFIKINGSKFSVAEVRGIRLCGNCVTIIVNDMKRPEREIKFWSLKNASRFYQRISIALERCGSELRQY